VEELRLAEEVQRSCEAGRHRAETELRCDAVFGYQYCSDFLLLFVVGGAESGGGRAEAG